MRSTTALNAGVFCSLFPGTSIFQKERYKALDLPSFAVEQPSTIDLLFYLFTSPPATAEYFAVRIYQYLLYDVKQWLKL